MLQFLIFFHILGKHALKGNKVVLNFFSVVDGYAREGLVNLARGLDLRLWKKEKYVADVVFL
jgi:hypothetical protein